MATDIFAHTIGRVDFFDGVVRLDLVTLSRDGTDTRGDVKHSVYMPLGGFMRGAATLENFIRELVERGVVPGLAPTNPTVPATSPTTGQPAATAPAVSPNFR